MWDKNDGKVNSEVELVNNPKVLICCSSYNHEKYISQMIESVLSQTYSNWELFIVDDGSTDGTPTVISKFLYDPRISFCGLKENTSVVGSNRMINDYVQKNDAKYFCGLASDDFWHPQKLEKQVVFLESHPSYKACFSWDKIIMDEGASDLLYDGYSHVSSMSRYESVRFLLLEHNYFSASSMMIYRDIYSHYGGYNWTYRNLQDYELWIRFQLEHSLYMMPEELNNYRRHAGNLSASSTAQVRTINESFVILSKYFREMTDEQFRIIFFSDFAYYDSSTHNELLAEKISILLRSGSCELILVAVQMYLEESYSNSELLSILENNYGLSVSRFHQLTGSFGILTQLFNEQAQKVDYSFNRVEALLDLIDSNNYSLERLSRYQYQSLAKLMYYEWGQTKTIQSYLRIRDHIWIKQNEINLRETKLLVISKEYSERVDEIAAEIGITHVAILPTTHDLFDCENHDIYTSPKYQGVNLVDSLNHRVKYLWEIEIERIDSVIFWGCVNEHYPLTRVLDGISLATIVGYIPDETDNVAAENIGHLIRCIK